MLDTAVRTRAAESTAQSAPWYKDAVIYQVHVRSFYDSNADGIGDFRGLTQKLDYIQELGVTAIWLLPFFPSPLRDDGYDIADYTNVNPIYGTLRDFRNFLREAHRRELRVITELVMNHTSDQHEWFQKSRQAPPGSKWRNYYVWSDTPDKYREARIIFQDFEASNWTWDPVAGAYFWHRFYSHQPDLNFDNPEVRRAMFSVIEFWLDMGVDGVRLDAVPYLYQREGTNCENLPETHAYLRELRAHIDAKYKDRMLLAEANQWPEDAVAYFGDGDECHMNFHFPLMPRLFMAIEREDRFPVIDILDQTPDVPPGCQWGIFLRNHDELTLEMVTDEERDYMYRVYAEDTQARINLGIRRRLAPLLRNNRRKMELMNGLLLSLPGTPIIYYGDEIGMGDNIYLGDRNGVRTPMQWNSDRNSGFSRANPQRLFLPTIIDSEYHYTVRNVEIEHNSPHALLWWMRRIINLRKQFSAFGNGTIEFLAPDNPKVLTYLRRYEDETIVVVANLSRFVQATQLDLSQFRGQTPIEMFGQTEFPPIGELPYFLTLGPYGFYWFRLQWTEREAVAMTPQQLPDCHLSGSWDMLFQSRARVSLNKALPAFLARHRWYAGKARTIQDVGLVDSFPVPASKSEPMYLLLIEVRYSDGEPDLYQVPVVFADETRAANILGDHPQGGILTVIGDDTGEQRVLCEATWERDFWQPLLQLLAKRRGLQGERGGVTSQQTKAFRQLVGPDPSAGAIAIHGGQQSNTSVIFGERVILKMFRRIKEGVNPDLEIGRFLTEQTKLRNVPRVAGAIEYHEADAEPMTLAILHEFVPNEGDAWVFTLDELSRYLERVESWSTELEPVRPPKVRQSLVELADTEPPDAARETIGAYLQSAALLGQRTAQLHQALGSSEVEPNFKPEPFTKLYQRSLYQSMRAHARRAWGLLRRQRDKLPEVLWPTVDQLLDSEPQVLARFHNVLDTKIEAMRVRCHGDYHLGQVLYTGKDFLIIDFEGEPERSMGERRIKMSPLKDVAGMIRSFHYAGHAALLSHAPELSTPPDRLAALAEWTQLWYVWSSAAFLRGYLNEAQGAGFLPSDRGQLDALLNAYILEKAIYELIYELNNRPDWVLIPLQAVVELVRQE